MPRAEQPRIAVLGSGPVGLEAALTARALGYPVTIYERGRAAENVQRWGHVRLFTPFGMNATALGRAALRFDNPKHELPADSDHLSGRDFVAAYLEPLAMSSALIDSLKLENQVVQIGRSGMFRDEMERRGERPFRMLLREAKGTERFDEADIILDCTGTYGSPRCLGDGGIPAIGELAARAQIAFGLDDITGSDKAKYAGKSVLVVGGGMSAATQVVRLAELAEKQPEMWIVWLARGGRTQPIPRLANDPFRERDRLAGKANMLATRGEGNVEFHAGCAIDEVVPLGPDKGFRVTARVGGKPKSWDVERIAACVGFQADGGMTRELNLGNIRGIKTGESNYYVLGAKSHDRNSQFLMQAGFEQVRTAFSAISGKTDPFGGARPATLLQRAGR